MEVDYFTRAWSDRTRGNGFRLKESRFKLGIRKKFFTARVVRNCVRLPRKAVAVVSLEMFKIRLDGAQSNLFYWEVLLPTAWGWNLKVPSDPNHSMIL